VSNLYKAVLNRREYFRGLYDAFSVNRKLFLGPYNPLILVVRRVRKYFEEVMPDAIIWNPLINLDKNKEMYKELSLRFIKDEDLKASAYPFIVMV
jgi:hypothetical protein